MSIRIRKAEHSGPKKGQGALWGRKKEAKSGSNKIRREQGKCETKVVPAVPEQDCVDTSAATEASSLAVT